MLRGARGGTQPSQLPALPPVCCRLLSKILSECEDADEIEFLADGSWCPIRAERERSCSPQGPILVLGESGALRPVWSCHTPSVLCFQY